MRFLLDRYFKLNALKSYSPEQSRRCPRNGKQVAADHTATAFRRGKAICWLLMTTCEPGDRPKTVSWHCGERFLVYRFLPVSVLFYFPLRVLMLGFFRKEGREITFRDRS